MWVTFCSPSDRQDRNLLKSKPQFTKYVDGTHQIGLLCLHVFFTSNTVHPARRVTSIFFISTGFKIKATMLAGKLYSCNAYAKVFLQGLILTSALESEICSSKFYFLANELLFYFLHFCPCGLSSVIINCLFSVLLKLNLSVWQLFLWYNSKM